MPLTSKGQEIMGALQKTYGSKEKAKEVFYAMKNSGKIEGVDADDDDKPRRKSKVTQRDPFGREKSIYEEDAWSPEARAAAIEARKRKATGKKAASSSNPESPHGSIYTHAGTANLAAQGFQPKGRAENTQHGAALTAWWHAKNIGKPATAVIGGRGWVILKPGETVPYGTPHMMVSPEGVLHAYSYKLEKKDAEGERAIAKLKARDTMPLFQTIEDHVKAQPFYIVPIEHKTLDLASPDFTDSNPNSVVLYDKVELDDAAALRYTADGYLVTQPRVARTGIQLYKGKECGKAELDVVRVLRPADSVFAQDALRSFAHRPVTIEHPPEPLTADNWKKYAVGQIGDEVLKDGEFIRVPMMVCDAAAIQAVKDGKQELSFGYSCDIDWTAGVTDSGENYDAIQRNIRGNHLAIVGCARGGSKLKLGDVSRKGDFEMSDTLRTVIIDGINVQMSDTAAQVVQRTIKMLSDEVENFKEKAEEKEEEAKKAKEKKDAATAEAATIISTKDAEIATLKSQLKDAEMTPQKLDALVKDRSEVIDKALVALNDKNASFDGKTVNEIRRQVVDSKLGSQAKTWTDEMVTASFNTLTADTKIKSGGYRDAAAALSRPGFGDDGDAREASYRAYDDALTSAWRTPAKSN